MGKYWLLKLLRGKMKKDEIIGIIAYMLVMIMFVLLLRSDKPGDSHYQKELAKDYVEWEAQERGECVDRDNIEFID